MASDIVELASLMEESINEEANKSLTSSSEYSIIMVPERLRLVKRTIYTPKVVSIGPYHHQREELKARAGYKKSCLDYLRKMTHKPLVPFIEVVQRNEKPLRDYYAGGIPSGSNEFVQIILVDAVFIIVFLIQLKFRMMLDERDRVFGSASMSQDICFDMLLLENQIPFFILADPYNSAMEAPSDMIDIYDLSCNCFRELMHLEVRESTLAHIRSRGIQHFVDFLRALHSPSRDPRELQNTTSHGIDASLHLRRQGSLEPSTVTIPSITELHKAGVKFKVVGSTNLFDLRFGNGILEFPKIVVGKESEISTRNMLVYEKCCLASNHISDSIVLLDKLIKTQDDVDLLVKFGILQNRLGDGSKVLLLIKELADETFLDLKRFWFADTCKRMNTHRESSSGRWRARWYDWKKNLMETYFKTPWSGISVVAAIVLLTLTAMQAVYAILSFRSSYSVGKQA